MRDLLPQVKIISVLCSVSFNLIIIFHELRDESYLGTQSLVVLLTIGLFNVYQKTLYALNVLDDSQKYFN